MVLSTTITMLFNTRSLGIYLNTNSLNEYYYDVELIMFV